MRIFRELYEPLLAAMLWATLAIASLTVRDATGSQMLIWAPSGVAVAAFHATRRRGWPMLAAVLLTGQALTMSFVSASPLQAIAFSVASTVQAVIAAFIGIAVLGGRREIPRSFHHIAGLFLAAVVGSLVGALVAIPYHVEQTVAEFAWWFLANVIAILTLAPLLFWLRQHLGFGPKVLAVRLDREFLFALGGCATLAAVALQVREGALMPLLVAAMVFLTMRYGQLATLFCVLTYTIVSTILSMGGNSPMPFLVATPQEARLIMQSWLLAMLATALPMAAMLVKRGEMQLELLRRNSDMHETLLLLDLAEQLAGIGRWRLDLETGAQDWSAKMLELNGLPRSLGPNPGDVRDLLPDGGNALFGAIARHWDTREPFSFTYSVKPEKQPERLLRISVLNEFDDDGRRIAVFGAAMDVTEQARREEALDLARGRAVRLAAEAQKLANTDPLTGLPNRRCTFARLDSMIAVATKREKPLAAVMFDIDHFKRVNDTYGHQTGDEVISRVAQLARRQARRGDMVGRIGGEEFVWLLPGLDEKGARLLAERLRGSIEEGTEEAGVPEVTISVGLALLRGGDNGEKLLARADAALYEAKQGGRNQVRKAA